MDKNNATTKGKLPLRGIPQQRKSQRFQELDYSKLFDCHWVTDYPEVQEALKVIYQEFPFKNNGKKHRSKVKGHIKSIVLDLFVAWENDSNRYVGISLSKDSYKRRVTRYGKIFVDYRPMVTALNGLVALGYVEKNPGWKNRQTGEGRITRIKATSKLIDLVKQHRVEPYCSSRFFGSQG